MDISNIDAVNHYDVPMHQGKVTCIIPYTNETNIGPFEIQ